MRVESFRRSLFLAVLAGGSALAVAVGCSAPYKAKDGLPVCDDGDPACNGDSNREAPRKASSSSSSTTENTEPAEATTPTSNTQADAGVDAAPPPKQPSCVKLEACCDQLKQAGYLTDTCLGVVATNNNAACYSQHKGYVDTGDCSW